MTDEDIFETIVKVFEWDLLPPDKRSSKPPKPSEHALVEIIKKKPVSFGPEELRTLANLTVRLLDNWNTFSGWSILNLCNILALGGATGWHSPLETGLQHDTYCQRPTNAHVHSIIVEMLMRAGVFRLGETPLFHDMAFLYTQKTNFGRWGMLLLTDQRLFVVGPANYAAATSYRPSYGEQSRSEPWLRCLDYLELNLLSEATVNNNTAQFIYNNGCIKSSKHEFYGPLWIRFSLDDTHSYKKGPVKVYIRAMEIDRMVKGVPKDDAARRIGLVTKKIREIQSS